MLQELVNEVHTVYCVRQIRPLNMYGTMHGTLRSDIASSRILNRPHAE